MRAPVVVVNFKAYPEAEAERAVRLSRVCQKVSRESGVPVAVCPPNFYAAVVARTLDVTVFAQGVDPMPPGAATGSITPSMIHASDVEGTLINHSERRMPREDIGKAVSMCSELGIFTMVCAKDADEAADLASFGPSAVAVEPPELIGGDVSVTTADPDVVRGTVEKVHAVDPGVLVYCGAGVKTGADVSAALSLGAHGVLLASGVVKAPDPEKALRELVSGARSCVARVVVAIGFILEWLFICSSEQHEGRSEARGSLLRQLRRQDRGGGPQD